MLFIANHSTDEYKELELQLFSWMDLDDLEVQMAEFQEHSVWKSRFTELRKEIEILEDYVHKESYASTENLILNV